MTKKENQNAIKHGGAGAIKRLTSGAPLIGLAAEAEQSVIKDLDEQGRITFVERNAIRCQAATELYWNAINTAADSGDLVKLDGYIAKFGWLIGVAGRAWEALAKDTKNNKQPLNVLLGREANDRTD